MLLTVHQTQIPSPPQAQESLSTLSGAQYRDHLSLLRLESWLFLHCKDNGVRCRTHKHNTMHSCAKTPTGSQRRSQGKATSGKMSVDVRLNLEAGLQISLKLCSNLWEDKIIGLSKAGDVPCWEKVLSILGLAESNKYYSKALSLQCLSCLGLNVHVHKWNSPFCLSESSVLSWAIKPVPHGSKSVYLAFGKHRHDLSGFTTEECHSVFKTWRGGHSSDSQIASLQSDFNMANRLRLQA